MPDAPSERTDPDLVVFREARSPFEARIIAAVLEDAEIPAFVAGGLLTDEFAMSQRLMNLQGVAVQVHRDRLDDAERALAAAKAAGAGLEDADVGPAGAADQRAAAQAAAPTRFGHRRLFAFALLVSGLVPTFAILWLDARAEAVAMRSTPLQDIEATRDGLEFRWKADGRLAHRTVDANSDGIPEQQSTYARDGSVAYRGYDADENGITERVEDLDQAGRVVRIAVDVDQDGRFDTVTEVLADGLELVWSDAGGDGVFDRLELRRGDALLRVQELRGDEGYQLVK